MSHDLQTHDSLAYEAEKEIYVDNLTCSYEGIFNFEKSVQFVREWCDAKGYYYIITSRSDKILPEGVNRVVVFEMQKRIGGDLNSFLKLKLQADKIKDVVVENKGHRRNMNKGKIKGVILGFLMSSRRQRWELRPWFYFLRGVIDKFIHKIDRPEYVDVVTGDGKDLSDKLKGFWQAYSYVEHEEKKEEIKQKEEKE